MANVHYARIGDVCKHLPLAEVLAIERPGSYWESHAGSSSYPLTRSPERDYRVFLFLERAVRSSVLEGSAYRRLLHPLERGRTPPTYPGSPLIAMELLGAAGGRFVFCNLDGASLANIAEDARALGVPSGRERLVQGTGSRPWKRSSPVSPKRRPPRRSCTWTPTAQWNSGALARPRWTSSRAAQRGVRCMLWYGFDARGARAAVLEALRGRIAGGAWYGEVSLCAEDLSELAFDPGVLGCGVVMCNVGREALGACSRLGEGLTQAYAGARLPNGREGALEYEEGTF
jgi:hypothetical protein